MKKLGAPMPRVNVIVQSAEEGKPRSWKLSFMSSNFVEPYPTKRTPLPELSPSPIHSSIGFSAPANVAKNPLSSLSPLEGAASPPPMTFPFLPQMPPPLIPASPPYASSLPPCSAFEAGAPVPEPVMKQALWCVAKSSVPSDTLQEAMDYACGRGGADCEEIKLHESCYYPDTILAHASYAFNSYWQKHKRNGGTCNFGGIAMLINIYPSFLDCRSLHS